MDRPDLDEFLTALDGFLGRQNAPKDAGALKFLDIFCRSIGSSEGHMLKMGPEKRLLSFLSSGLGPQFNEEFNAVRPAAGDTAPMDIAYRDHKVVAIVNLKKEKGLPAWFINFINKHGFKSLVAVPLLNQNQSVGVLCAYYDDVCLFDQGTMDRLLIIGRMVGVSMEKAVPESPAGRGVENIALGRLIKNLEDDQMTRSELLEVLTDSLAGSVKAAGIFWGPLRKVEGVWHITVAAGSGIYDFSMGRRFPLPKTLVASLERGGGSSILMSEKDWGYLKSVVSGAPRHIMGVPMKWGGELLGGVFVWRDDNEFEKHERTALGQVAGLASIILNAAGQK